MKWHPQRARSEWARQGFPDEETAAFWGERACGAACAQAIISHFTGRDLRLFDLVQDGLRTGAYGQRGWVHAGLAKRLNGLGVKAEARPMGGRFDDWRGELTSGAVLIASVALGYPDDGHSGGHLVVVHGWVEDECGARLQLMDPSDYGPHVAELPAERFFPSFSGRVIRCAQA